VAPCHMIVKYLRKTNAIAEQAKRNSKLIGRYMVQGIRKIISLLRVKRNSMIFLILFSGAD
jgi:hypothetical protein